MKRLFTVLALFVALQATLISQSETLVNKTWEHSFGAPNDYEWAASVLDNSGNLLTTGHTTINDTNTELLLLKQNPDGTVLWQQAFQLAQNTMNGGVALAVDTSDNIYVAGVTSTSGNLSDFNFLVLKYNSGGTKIWHQTFNGTGSGADVPTGIIANTSRVYVCGASKGSSTNMDYWALRLTASNGSLEWQKRYDYAGLDDIPANMVVDASGNVVLTGSSAASAVNWEVATVKYGYSIGTLLNENRVPNDDSLGLTKPSAITTDASGNFIISGIKTTNGTHFDIRTIKLTSSLGVVWVQDYDSGAKVDSVSAIVCDTSGGIVLTGWSSTQQGGSDILTLRYKADGTLGWAHKRTVSPQDLPSKGRAVALDANENIMVAGDLKGGMVVTTYSPDGVPVWEKALNSSDQSSRPLSLLPNLQGEVFLTSIVRSQNGKRYRTYKLNTLERPATPHFDTSGIPLYAKDEIIVRFKPGVVKNSFVDNKDLRFGTMDDIIGDSATLQALADKLSASDFEDWYAFKVFPNRTTADSLAVTRLGKTIHVPDFHNTMLLLVPREYTRIEDERDIRDTLEGEGMECIVKFADINPIVTVDACEPDDANYANQGNLHPTTTYPNGHINMEEAWCIAGASGSGIVAAITDTGIRWSHEDFQDGNGSSVVIGGTDYANGTPILTNNENDFGDHGTRVASVAGSVRNNAKGLAGIAGGSGTGDGVRLVGLRCIDQKFPNDPNTFFTVTDLIQAYDDAVGLHGAQIINTSGGYNSLSSENSILFREKIHFANRMGVVICASRGNDQTFLGIPIDAHRFPGTIQDEWVLCIGGTGTNGEYNPECRLGKTIDVAAPSRWQLTRSAQNFVPNTNPPQASDQAYGGISFTSGATPHATGLAAIMLNYYSPPLATQLVQEDVEYIIQASATDVGDVGPDDETGHGRINAGAALQMIEQPHCNVFHFGTDVNPDTRVSQQVADDIALELTEPYTTESGQSFDKGNYTADVYKVTATVTHSLPGSFQITHSWERHSGSTVFDLYTTSGGNKLLPVEIVKFVGTLSQNTAVVEGYVYYLKNAACTVEGWIPASPESAELTYSLIGCSMTNTEEVATPTLQVFPNPATGLLTVGIPQGTTSDFQRILVHDFSGREVMRLAATAVERQANAFQLDVSGLPPGIYSCALTSPDNRLTAKFIKH